MNQKISARLQTPADENGQRKDVHLITTSDEVIVHPESDTPETMTQYIDETDQVLENAINTTNEASKKVDQALENIDGKIDNMVSNKIDDVKKEIDQTIDKKIETQTTTIIQKSPGSKIELSESQPDPIDNGNILWFQPLSDESASTDTPSINPSSDVNTGKSGTETKSDDGTTTKTPSTNPSSDVNTGESGTETKSDGGTTTETPSTSGSSESSSST